MAWLPNKLVAAPLAAKNLMDLLGIRGVEVDVVCNLPATLMLGVADVTDDPAVWEKVDVVRAEIDAHLAEVIPYLRVHPDNTRVYDSGDVFDIHRPKVVKFAFGGGVHMCAGMWAARWSIGSIAVPMLFRPSRGFAAPRIERAFGSDSRPVGCWSTGYVGKDPGRQLNDRGRNSGRAGMSHRWRRQCRGATGGSLRDEGFTGNITLIGEESEQPYQRPPLTKDFLHRETASVGLHPIRDHFESHLHSSAVAASG